MKSKETILRIKRLIYYYKRSVQISWQSSPALFLARIVCELISIAIPIVSLYLSRNIINVLGQSGYETQATDFISILFLFTFFQLVGTIVARINGAVGALHNDKIGREIDLELIRQINRLDISFFDNPTFYDQMQNAVKDSKYMQSLTWMALSLVKSAVQFVTNLIILCGLNIALPVLIILMSLPSVFVDKYVAKRQYDWQKQRVRNDRKLGYVRNVLLSKQTAKDIRIWNAQEYFLSKFIDMWHSWFSEKKTMERKKILLTVSVSILPLVATTIVLLAVGNGIVLGKLTLGDYSLYAGVSAQLRTTLIALTGVINQSYESELRLSNYAEFLRTEPFVKNVGRLEIYEVETIDFCNVTFSYPQTQKIVLKNVSFGIKKGESLALVGLNGAGKSTIVKLLLRLYDPDDGEILVNGINIKEYDLQSYYKCVGVVFQDYHHYNLKIREVISLSDIEGMGNDERICQACMKANLDESLLKHEDGIDTYLGKIFDENGIELSGGNWQKIAIAQAYFKESSLMVFDEPNSALDPNAEYQLFENMTTLGSGKCVVYVTHRLSSATHASRILVIHNGECCEKGTHNQLMTQKGLYYELFTKQAEHYR